MAGPPRESLHSGTRQLAVLVPEGLDGGLSPVALDLPGLLHRWPRARGVELTPRVMLHFLLQDPEPGKSTALALARRVPR